jgi:hypothetical protein
MLKQYAREGRRGVERQRRREELGRDQISCTGNERARMWFCGDIKPPSLNGVLLTSKTVYVEHPPGFEASGKED